MNKIFNYLQIWDLRVGKGSIRHFQGPHICGDAIDLWVRIEMF